MEGASLTDPPGPRTRFSDSDYREAIAAEKHEYIDTEKVSRAAGEEAEATCCGWKTRYDCTYICYSFFAEGAEYAFAWETYYDETHRGYSNERVWYDELTQGVRFKVRYVKGDPRLHFPADKRFESLTNPLFVGKK